MSGGAGGAGSGRLLQAQVVGGAGGKPISVSGSAASGGAALEVSRRNRPGRGEEDVRGLQVAVDDPGPVGQREERLRCSRRAPATSAAGRVPAPAGRRRAGCRSRLHDDVRRGAVRRPRLAVVEDADDAGVVESSGEPGLGEQPRAVHGSSSLREHLDRDGAVGRRSSWARCTVPMPPEPRRPRSRYRPSGRPA